MKKMILEQQIKNSAIYSMPLVQFGGGREMQLRGERLICLKTQGGGGQAATQRDPPTTTRNEDSKQTIIGGNTASERDSQELIIGIGIKSMKMHQAPTVNTARKKSNTPYFSPHDGINIRF
jgi:hypothetical protein